MDYIELNKKNTMLIIEESTPTKIKRLENDRYRIQLDMFSKYVDKDDALLDIGVRDGAFLNMLKKEGFTNLYGIDIFEKSIELLREKNIDGEVANAQEFSLNKKFKIVIMSHVLEHCPNPKKVLENVYNHTVENAVILIEVPIELGYPKPTEKDAHYFNFHSLSDVLLVLGDKWFMLNKFISEKRIKLVARRI